MLDRHPAVAGCLSPAGWIGLAALAVVAAVQLLGVRTWPFELLHHFAPQAVAAAGVLALMFAALRHGPATSAAVLLALTFGGIYKDAPQPLERGMLTPFGAAQAFDIEGIGARSRAMTLITHNLRVGNWRYRDVHAWLAGRPADVVVLQEVSSGMAALVDGLGAAYPHRRIVAADGSPVAGGEPMGAGLALLSRHPILRHDLVAADRGGRPALVARLSVAGADDPWIVALHPRAPVDPDGLAARDGHLAAVAAAIAGLAGPVIVAGDLNVTPYAPAFRRFLRETGTKTFAALPATFPATLGPFGLAIDHVLVSGIRLADLRTLPAIGSDHRPLQALLFLPAAADRPDPPRPLDG